MWTQTVRHLAVVGSLLGASSALPQGTSGDSSSSTACNNSPSLCDKKYSEITHLGAHDSAFLRDDSTGNSIAGNQYYNATYALDAGLRLLQAQVHVEDSELRLCHTSCSILDAGPLQDWLTKVREWIDDKPNDVVTILLVNDDDGTTADFAKAFEGAGLSQYGYVPEGTTGGWPTLQSMIDDKKRVVSFVTNIETDQSSAYLLDEFSHVFETPFEVTELTGFGCDVDRPKKIASGADAIADGKLSLVNHFKYAGITDSIQFPDVDSIQTVNDPGTSQGNIGLHLQTCSKEWGSRPNFVLVDFYSEGDPLAAVDSMNSVSDATGREENVPTTNDAGERRNNLGSAALVAALAGAIMLI
ncbi:hypothetical protein N3K66_002694 [Trichothecium roseum]|uniref:Uncharacterized protein n=1 Tax=Trichothecium roseum TaxID=47278 RepID=A0ACC0VA85_9HYPO|nr:hypothetical protein N3K66_002694 [Trichothecium roseum]